MSCLEALLRNAMTLHLRDEDGVVYVNTKPCVNVRDEDRRGVAFKVEQDDIVPMQVYVRPLE